jgi:PleD family two-component response regulator
LDRVSGQAFDDVAHMSPTEPRKRESRRPSSMMSERGRKGHNITPTVILLVEDEALLLVDVEDGLTDAGFERVAAHEGNQALAALDADM